MLRSFCLIDRVRMRMSMVAASMVSVLVIGCGLPEEKSYQLEQPIEMGPWTFAVTDTKERTENRGGNRFKKIFVVLDLENYEERHEKPFDDFLNGTTKKSVIARPKIWLVSDTRKKFDGWVSPKSGGSMRSRRWQVEFLLAEFSLRENTSDTAKRYLDKHAADFHLVIRNPDRRKGQPREVTIQLP